MKTILRISAAAAVLCLGSLQAAEDETALGNIDVVETQQQPATGQDKTADLVDKQDIRNTDARTVIEALNQVPGVFATYSGEEGRGGVNIRGFSGTRVPVYVDGIPVYAPYDRSVDLNRFVTYDVGEIEVLKGYVSPLFGPNTIGGAVNIISLKPTREFEGEIGGGWISGDGHEEFVSLGTNQDLWYAIVSASNLQRDYYRLPSNYEPAGDQHGHKRVNSDFQDTKAGIKIGVTPNDTDEYVFHYVIQKGDKGQPYYAADYDPATNPDLYGPRHWNWPDLDKTSYSVITTTALKEHTLKSRFYYDKFKNKVEWDDSKYGVGDPYGSNKYDDNTFGGTLEDDIQLTKDHLLKIAVSQKYDRHKFNEKTWDNITYPLADDNGKAEDKTFSLGLEYIWRLDDKLTWVVGVAYDRNKVTKVEGVTPRPGPGSGIIDTPTTTAFSPQTILYYQANEDLLLYGSVSRKNNIPTLRQRYSTEDYRIEPNHKLDAEKATNYEIGAEYLINNDHILKGAVFFTRTDDYIARVKHSKDLWHPWGYTSLENAEEEEHKGFELSLNSYWSDALSGVFSYSYVDADIKKGGTSNATNVADIPKHSFYASLKYSPIESVDIIPILRYESGRFVAVGINEKSLDYTLVDLRVAYRPIQDLEIGVGIKNIFDEYYYYDIGYPQEGRSYYANVRYNF